jgi:hypothetical protein
LYLRTIIKIDNHLLRNRFSSLITHTVTRSVGRSQWNVTKIMLSWRTWDGEARALWGCTSDRPRNLCKIYSPFVLTMESRASKRNIINQCKWKFICGRKRNMLHRRPDSSPFWQDDETYSLLVLRPYPEVTERSNMDLSTNSASDSSFYAFPTNLLLCFLLDSSGRSVHTNVGCRNQVITFASVSLTWQPGLQQ